MSALRIAELLLSRCKERLAENHATMDKGGAVEQYQRLVGKNQELRWMMDLTKEYLQQVESEEELDEL
jgi:hypothetical protein